MAFPILFHYFLTRIRIAHWKTSNVHLCGGVVSGRDPDVADEGKTRGDHGPLRPQGRNGLWRIAKEGLAGEIEARYHGITGQVAGASTRWCAMPQVQGPEPTLLAQLD